MIRNDDKQTSARQTLLTLAEAARHLRVSGRTVTRLISSGYFPVVRITSRALRVDLADLDRFVERAKDSGITITDQALKKSLRRPIRRRLGSARE